MAKRKKTQEEVDAENMAAEMALVEHEQAEYDENQIPDDAEAGAPEQEPAPEVVEDPLPPKKVERLTRRTLACRLTDEEFLARAVALAKTTQDVSITEERHADIKAEMKAEVTKLTAERGRLASIVARREEMREVNVLIIYDHEKALVTEIRQDTGETLNSRQMTEGERQMPLL